MNIVAQIVRVLTFLNFRQNLFIRLSQREGAILRGFLKYSSADEDDCEKGQEETLGGSQPPEIATLN